jgi:hypothetical protein
MLVGTLAQAGNTRIVCSFESPDEVQGIKATGASVRRVAEHATQGQYALEVRFDAGEASGIEIPVRAGDWRGYGSVGLDATNTSDEEVVFSLEVRDRAGAETRGRSWELAPGQRGGFGLLLNAPPPLGMQGAPPVGGYLLLCDADHKPVDLARIAVVRISMSNLSRPRTVVFDNLRLGPAVSYEKIVDPFGQYTREDWPGKVKSEAELKAQLVEEQAELREHPVLPDRDEYGGWTAGPKLEATGYFRTVKREGKWWLVTPSGHLFFSLGVDTVDAAHSSTMVEGREEMFEWLPGDSDPLAAHYTDLGESGPAPGYTGSWQPAPRAFSFYMANLERKYGKDWYNSWRAMTLARLPAWGFNTLANWSDRRLFVPKKVPYVATLSVRGEMEQLSHTPPFPELRMYDSFDPQFVAAVDRSVRGAAARRNDPWLVGYFVDNELPWGFVRNDRTRYALAVEVLLLGAGSPAKRALVAQLKGRYGSIEKLNAAWKAGLASWEELLQKPYRPKGDLTSAAREDMGAFVKELAVRYFRTVRDTLKKYDPNHLYLGVRFAWLVQEELSWTTPEVEEAATQYCDVISFNAYAPPLDARWDFLKRLDKPTIIGEYNVGAPGGGIWYPGAVAATSQTDRARMYQEWVRSAVDRPTLVGCHFFLYVDEPLAGGGFFDENLYSGFVTVTDSVYPEMVEAAKAVHAEVYRRRFSGAASADASR